MQYIGKIDKNLYRVVTENITSEDIIITDERIEHIKKRHPNDYELFFEYIMQIIENPDYILEANKPHTAFVLKKLTLNGERFQLIVRLKTLGDPDEYKNSIITFLKIDEYRYDRYLRTKKILYAVDKKE